MVQKRKVNTGQVVSDKMDKTVVVVVERYQAHRLYKRRIKRVTRFKAHDEQNACKLGDTVRIEETRPLSKDKRWRVVEVLARGELAELAELAEIQPKEIDEGTMSELSQ
ncbi:MAG: 30S ribosomal protein S17 [Dehalococcoidia bacterium]